MKMSDDELIRNLELVRHGGADAIVLFIKISRAIYETGSTEEFDSWVTVATPALPEASRNAAMGLLLRSFFGEYELIEERYETLQ